MKWGKRGTYLFVALIALGTTDGASAQQFTLRHVRDIAVKPFIDTAESMVDGEASAFDRNMGTLWLGDDDGDAIREVDPATGQLRSTITRATLESAWLLGGSTRAWTDNRAQDIEALAYATGGPGSQDDILYVFSTDCCPNTEKNAGVFRLFRNQNMDFTRDTYQGTLVTQTSIHAAAWNPKDQQLYVVATGDGRNIRTYDYRNDAVSEPGLHR
jgi:hypothetical protein